MAVSSLILLPLTPARGVEAEAPISVKAVEGTAEYTSKAGGLWKPLQAGATLGSGAVVRTGGASAVDLIFPNSGTVLRLVPDTELRVEKLLSVSTEIEDVTDTQLYLVKGSVIGSQRKLPKASSFSIMTPKGEALIRGTEYVVREDGAVSVLSGTVTVKYNNPGERGPKKFVVQAGESFDPATRTVVPTTDEFLQDIAYHVDTVRRGAMFFPVIGHASVSVRPSKGVSPVLPEGPPVPFWPTGMR